MLSKWVFTSHNDFLVIFTFIKFVFDQKGSIFIPHYVWDKNTSILISNLIKVKIPPKTL